AEVVAAHAETARLDAELAAARARRRDAAHKLVARGYKPSWIARELGVSPQAVDSFLNYHKNKPAKPVKGDPAT
ncbi:hypothetical protein, partial [Nocardia sp. XZ_19_369]|uniref:hypothetical protein n=1 Tax=Nocardia sp. XZ_19_369 TaxID=2769487 RepID=UPI00188F7ED6